jgi:hypothetical protein
MNRGKLLIASVLFFSLAALGMGSIVLAQDTPAPATDAAAAPVPAPVPADDAVVPSPDDPLPEEDVDVIKSIKDFFGKAWYLVTAGILFLLVALVRGKAKLGSWVIKVPWLSDWLDGAGSKAKFWIILILTGLGCAFGALIDVQNWVFNEIAKVALSGFAVGISTALMAMGVAKGKEVHTKPKHPPKRKNK